MQRSFPMLLVGIRTSSPRDRHFAGTLSFLLFIVFLVSEAASEYGPWFSWPSLRQPRDDEDVDLFGSDSEEDAELERQKAQRLAEYQAKKAAKGPGPVAKSSVLIDVKPWDDTTDWRSWRRMFEPFKWMVSFGVHLNWFPSDMAFASFKSHVSLKTTKLGRHLGGSHHWY